MAFTPLAMILMKLRLSRVDPAPISPHSFRPAPHRLPSCLITMDWSAPAAVRVRVRVKVNVRVMFIVMVRVRVRVQG